MPTPQEYVLSNLTYPQLAAYVPKPEQAIAESLSWAYQNIPGMKLLASTPQDAYYHAEGDVWTHTQMVCHALVQLPTYKTASADGQFVMWYAALLHDIAKPLCTVQQDDGKISSAGHSRAGAVDTRQLLWGAQVPFHLREAICQIVSVHQVPFYAFKDKARTPTFIAHSLSVQGQLDWLIAVARADMLGRHCVEAPQCLEDIELFEMLAIEEGCLTTPKSFPDADTRFEYFRTQGAIYPEVPFFKEPGPEVFVLAGLPASGKNTWVDSQKLDLPVVSFDDAKAALGLKQGDNIGQAVHLVLDQARELLRKKQSFIWNATHLSRQMREKSLGLIHQYGARSHIVYIEQPWQTLKQRNDARDSTLPSSKILEMTRKWEMPSLLEAHNVSFAINI